MLEHTPGRSPRRYEETAVVLAALGIVVLFLMPFAALALSLAAAVVLLISVWFFRVPRSWRTNLATVLVAFGLVVELLYVVTMPVGAVAHTG
jgi:hypothetical protein